MKNNFYDEMFEIVKLNGSMEKLYNHLAELEIKGLMGSKEYDEYLDLIKITKKIINKKFKHLKYTPDELKNYDKLLVGLNRLEDNDLILDVLELSTQNKIRRTLMQLYYFSVVNHIPIETIEDVTKEYAEDYGIDIEDYEEDEDDYFDEDEYYDDEQRERRIEIEENTDDFLYSKDELHVHLLLYFLEQEIKSQKNKRIKNKLIRVKYRLIYVLPIIEGNFLNNPSNFTMPNLYTELYNFKVEKILDDVKDEIIRQDYEKARAELDYLSGISDEYYQKEDNKLKIILRSIYLRMYLAIQLTKENDIELETDKEEIDYKSKKTKEYVEKAYKLKKQISTLKKVDL